jgi:hypothetical protein
MKTQQPKKSAAIFLAAALLFTSTACSENLPDATETTVNSTFLAESFIYTQGTAALFTLNSPTPRQAESYRLHLLFEGRRRKFNRGGEGGARGG